MTAKGAATGRLGRMVRDARSSRGWSQTELAEHAGVSRPTIARIEAGRDVTTSTLAKVAGALGLKIGFETRKRI